LEFSQLRLVLLSSDVLISYVAAFLVELQTLYHKYDILDCHLQILPVTIKYHLHYSECCRTMYNNPLHHLNLLLKLVSPFVLIFTFLWMCFVLFGPNHLAYAICIRPFLRCPLSIFKLSEITLFLLP
jgi:hypothetical protein